MIADRRSQILATETWFKSRVQAKASGSSEPQAKLWWSSACFYKAGSQITTNDILLVFDERRNVQLLGQ